MKEQVQQSKALHKAEVEELNHKVWEANRAAQKYNIEVSSFRVCFLEDIISMNFKRN